MVLATRTGQPTATLPCRITSPLRPQRETCGSHFGAPPVMPCAVYFHGREMEYDAVFASVDEDEPLIEIMSDEDEDGQSSDGGRTQDLIDMQVIIRGVPD